MPARARRRSRRHGPPAPSNPCGPGLLTPGRKIHDPKHPLADEEGYVTLANVNPVEEMVDMITASRAYEAGVTTMSTAVNMAERALGIGK